MEETPVYERIIYQNESKERQVRVVVNEFRGVEYLHIREYYLDFEGEWLPSNKGLAIPLEVESSRELFTAIAEIMSLAESDEVIERLFGNVIREIYSN